MADVKEIILRIDAQADATSVKDLKAWIEKEKDALVALGQAEDADVAKKEQIAKVTAQLQKDVKLLNDVMGAAKRTTVDAAKAIDVTTASYYDMQRALTTLKKAWKELSAEERAGAGGTEMLQKIKQLDAELKTLDGSIGQYQRNVGNYGQTFKQSLDQAQQGANGLQAGITALTSIMAASGVQSDGLTKTMIGLSAAVQLVLGARGIGELITKGKEAINTLFGAKQAAEGAATASKGAATAMEAQATATTTATVATKAFKAALIATGIGALVVALGQAIAHMEDLTKAFRDLTGDESQDDLDKLKKGIEDLNKELERQQTLYEATGAIAEESMLNELANLQKLSEAYEDYAQQIGAFGDLSFWDWLWTDGDKLDEALADYEQSVEDLRDKFTEAEAGVKSFIHAAQVKRAQAGMSDLQIEIDNVDRQVRALKRQADALYDQGFINIEQWRTYVREIKQGGEDLKDEAKKNAEDAARQRWQTEHDNAKAIAQQAEDAYKTEEQKLREKYEADKALLLKHHLSIGALTQKFNDDMLALEQKRHDEEAEDREWEAEQDRKEKEAQIKRAEANAAKLREIAKQTADYRLDQLDRETEMAMRQAEVQITDDEDLASRQYEIEQKANQDRLALLAQYAMQAQILGDQEQSLAYLQEAADLSVEIEQRAAEERERIRRRDKESRIEAAKQTVASVSSVLGSLADIYEANGEEDAKSAKKAKNLRIAGAYIDMFSGVVAAIRSSWNIKDPIAASVLAAANSAAVIAAGAANIAKIKSTDVSGTSSGSSSASATAAAPVVLPAVATTAIETGASTEDRLNRMASSQRVYILQSDIEAAGEQSRVQVAETTF